MQRSQSTSKPESRLRRARTGMFAVPADGLGWLTDAELRRRAGAQTYGKGYAYFRSAAVFELYRFAHSLEAMVAGSGVAPYRVRLQLGVHRIEQVNCSCPHPAAFCKHVVAVLLTLRECPEQVQVAPSLETELRRLSKQELTELILQLQQQEPELGYRIYRELTRPTQVTAPISRRRLAKAVDERLAALPEVGGVKALLALADGLFAEMRAWIHAGQPDAALAMLGALSEAMLAEPERFLEALETYRQGLTALGELWVQVLLLESAGLDDWSGRLRGWQRRLAGLGLGEPLHPALALLDAEEIRTLLNAAMQGLVEAESWRQQSNAESDRLAEVQLQLLRLQNRRQEALHLAQASGQHAAYALLLIEQAQAAEAVAYLLPRLTADLDLLTICGSLAEFGEGELALRLAGEALAAGAANYRLTVWLRDSAAVTEPELARLAAWQAVLQQARIEDYDALRRLYGGAWELVRERFLTQLRAACQAWPTQLIDILLVEGLLDEAMALADRHHQDTEAVQRVVSALQSREPAWCLQACRRQAEAIMQAGESRLYAEAVDWLKQMRQASVALDCEPAWQQELEALIAQHQRKYALRPLLENLR